MLEAALGPSGVSAFREAFQSTLPSTQKSFLLEKGEGGSAGVGKRFVSMTTAWAERRGIRKHGFQLLYPPKYGSAWELPPKG
jgi:hypothetical protein